MTTQTGQENGNSPFSNEPHLLFIYRRIRAMRERLTASHFGRVCAGSITRIGPGGAADRVVPDGSTPPKAHKSRRRPSTLS
jgi:hypothetical protein